MQANRPWGQFDHNCLIHKRSTFEVCSSGVVSGEVSDVVKGLSDVSECSTKKLWSEFICSKCAILNDVRSLYCKCLCSFFMYGKSSVGVNI